MSFLSSLTPIWGGDKTALSAWLNVQDDGLHVLVGVLLLLALALVTGRRLDDGRLWLVVLAVECLNEAIDLGTPNFPEANRAASIHDLILTMLLPTAILLLLRFTGRRERQAAASTEAASEANSARPSLDE